MSKLIIKPKNWGSFQHYRNRRPPWIKLHRTILDDFDYQGLQLASKALAPCLWLIASEEEDGHISVDLPKLAWRLRVSQSEIELAIKELISKGFFIVASGSIASCLHSAIPERETETETEGEGETEIASLLSAKGQRIPVQEIMSLYNEICVPFGRPVASVLSKKRQQAVKKIWRQSEHTRNLEWWKEYFDSAMQIEYMANGFTNPDGSGWKGADFDYLLQEKTVTRVVEHSA
jgi:hypothetical protein